jgi:hypothetical protein
MAPSEKQVRTTILIVYSQEIVTNAFVHRHRRRGQLMTLPVLLVEKERFAVDEKDRSVRIANTTMQNVNILALVKE